MFAEIIASRKLRLTDENGHKLPVSIFIGKPQPRPDNSGYECPYQIIGVGSQKAHVSHGKDSIQALNAALVMLGTTLNLLNDELGGRLSWEESPSREIGFP